MARYIKESTQQEQYPPISDASVVRTTQQLNDLKAYTDILTPLDEKRAAARQITSKTDETARLLKNNIGMILNAGKEPVKYRHGNYAISVKRRPPVEKDFDYKKFVDLLCESSDQEPDTVVAMVQEANMLLAFKTVLECIGIDAQTVTDCYEASVTKEEVFGYAVDVYCTVKPVADIQLAQYVEKLKEVPELKPDPAMLAAEAAEPAPEPVQEDAIVASVTAHVAKTAPALRLVAPVPTSARPITPAPTPAPTRATIPAPTSTRPAPSPSLRQSYRPPTRKP